MSRLIRAIVLAALVVGMLGIPASASSLAAPAAPSALTVNSIPMLLTWTDNSLNETGFSIERCYGPGCTAFGQIATVGVGVTSHTDVFSRATLIRYRVRAFNSAGYSAYSNIAEIALVSTNDVSASIAAAPTSGQAPLTVNFDGSASVALNGTISSWTWSFGDNQTASGVAVSHIYAAPGVYAASLKVTTAGPFGGASDSIAVIITVTAPPLLAPSDLSATAERRQIHLSWTNPVSSATSLKLERCTGAGCTSFTKIAVLTTTTTSFIDSGVKNRSTYTYRLAASDATATVYSNTATASVRR